MPKGTKMERGLPVAKKAKTSAAVVSDSPSDALLDAAAQICAGKRIKQARPTTIVFTGGPGVGKSTLAEHLVARLGDKAVLVPEAAMVAIDALNGMLGKSGQLGWRTAHSAAFGDGGRIAMEQETRALPRHRHLPLRMAIFRVREKQRGVQFYIRSHGARWHCIQHSAWISVAGVLECGCGGACGSAN